VGLIVVFIQKILSDKIEKGGLCTDAKSSFDCITHVCSFAKDDVRHCIGESGKIHERGTCLAADYLCYTNADCIEGGLPPSLLDFRYLMRNTIGYFCEPPPIDVPYGTCLCDTC
jgi:hypothetical protein